jgi:S-adenosylmethionine decarboxylase
MGNIGVHLIADLYGCDFDKLNNQSFLRSTLTTAAQVAGCRILSVNFESFEPQGQTGVVIVAESHLSIHTYPEFGYAATDLFTCGTQTMPWIALSSIIAALSPSRHEVKEIKRGLSNLI